MIEDNKTIIRRFVEEVYNKGDLDLLDELFASDFSVHSPDIDTDDLESFKGFICYARTAFPDLHFTIEDQIAEGEKVTTIWTLTGTNTGPLKDETVTGKEVKTKGISFTRISGGKIVEDLTRYNQWSVLKQLGVTPSLE